MIAMKTPGEMPEAEKNEGRSPQAVRAEAGPRALGLVRVRVQGG